MAADANIVIFERIKEEARGGKSMPSAIVAGYRKGIATIIDANVITLITAFILFVLATAGVKGFAFTLGVGTIVSLFTAVVFTQAFLGVFGRPSVPAFAARCSARAASSASAGTSTSAGEPVVLLDVGGDPADRGDLVRDQPAQPRHRLRVGAARITGGPREGRQRRGRAEPLEGVGVQRRPDPDGRPASSSGTNVHSRSRPPSVEPDKVSQVQTALQTGLRQWSRTASTRPRVGPTFGEQVADSAVYAIIFSLLVICAYVAFRFEPKYAVPVIIALLHDILITGGVYSLTGREVTSGTVAAFLTILGYSLYDTVIVFDRIRENVPRLPRAAFSQIVNRSMSEVLTRSLITGSLQRLPGDGAVHLRRRHPEGLRLRDDGRGRSRVPTRRSSSRRRC